MSGKLENIYKRMTGIDPRHGIQPPLIGPVLEKEISRLKGKTNGNEPIAGVLFDSREIVGYEILDSGSVPQIGGSEQFTLIGRRFADGTKQATFLFGANLNPEEVLEIGPKLPSDEWAQYDPSDVWVGGSGKKSVPPQMLP